MDRSEYYNRFIIMIVIGSGIFVNVLGGVIVYFWF